MADALTFRLLSLSLTDGWGYALTWRTYRFIIQGGTEPSIGYHIREDLDGPPPSFQPLLHCSLSVRIITIRKHIPSFFILTYTSSQPLLSSPLLALRTSQTRRPHQRANGYSSSHLSSNQASVGSSLPHREMRGSFGWRPCFRTKGSAGGW